MSERNLMTIAEVAAELRVSKMTVYRLCHNEALKNIRVGRSFRIDRASLDTYLERNEKGD